MDLESPRITDYVLANLHKGDKLVIVECPSSETSYIGVKRQGTLQFEVEYKYSAIEPSVRIRSVENPEYESLADAVYKALESGSHY